jgi:polysaccharide biosynthesis transport protein
LEFKNYISIIRKRLWLIVIITSFMMAATAIFSLFIMTPVYEAKATLIIGHATQTQDQKIGYDDILMFQKLVKTYSQLAKSETVGKEALEASGYGIGYPAFQDMLKVTSMSDTQILEISVSDGNPNEAADLANTVSRVFVKKANELMDAGNVKIMEEALPPITPKSPKPLFYTVIVALIGFALSIGLVLLIEYMDNTIRCEDDISKRLNIPVLASIPLVPGRKNKSTCVKLVDIKGSKSSVSELYRTLRTNIKFISFQKEAKTIVVTSPGPNDGKSLVTSNLAITMASARNKVLLIDCDLRKPMINRYFALSYALGLADILADNIPYKDAISSSRIENLDIMPCGSKLRNPSEMLDSNRMKELLDNLRKEYDYILLDTPPVVVVTDAALLASKCDSTILILSYGQTSIEGAIKAKELLDNVNARILGAVFNKVKVDRCGWYYGYYQNYYYGRKKEGMSGKPAHLKH